MRFLIALAALPWLGACSSPAPLPQAPTEVSPTGISKSWQCQENLDGLWTCTPPEQTPALKEPTPAATRPAAAAKNIEHLPPLTSSENTVVTAVEEPAAAIARPGEGWVLQVGAFRHKSDALVAAEHIGMAELRIIPTRRGDQDWYVLLLGAYHSHAEADTAGESFLAAVPGGSIWVRRANDLKKSLVHP